MTPDYKTTNLFKWLKRHNERLAARVETIREEQSKWLPYIVTNFPHYPSHGVDHSDRIVSQLSRLLFREGGSGGGDPEPVVHFSFAEIYCLICAAYLHDMGMVVSPGEQAEILASEAWKSFVAAGGKGQDAYAKYAELRTQTRTGSADRNHFLADTALRYVIADFVRRDHHERGVTTLQMHEFLKHLVDDGDSVAFETIAAICVGHGLDDRDIVDKERFPEERDVFGNKVNVRFLARLLRIGDLLDMDTGRADPMSARAVAPLPRDATPHWRQYSTKKHENVTPDAIEFRFECQDQDTHRILRDWLGWLESEVRATAVGQMHARRHGDWKPPQCAVASQSLPNDPTGGGQSTIVIKPAKGAVYAFHDWRIEMDQQAVLDLLIRRVYDNPLVFVRELIQNALDATRCRMYADFEEQNPGHPLPERPTHLPADFRSRYPLRLSLKQEPVKLTPDGPTETRPVFTIEDSGTGMDERIITRYFLQVGRSYYQSTEFRQRFKFAPTSRFGIGFLSVFAVSRNITVETARRDPESGVSRGTRLVLREPRNYLLTEQWKPFEERPHSSRTGTRIRIIMDHWPEAASLLKAVTGWCVAVEVPVTVEEAGSVTELRTERWKDGTVLAESKVDPKGRFVLRVFDVDRGGVEGQIAVVVYEDEQGEGWSDCWPDSIGLDGQKLDQPPDVGDGYLALHGIATGTMRRMTSDSTGWVSKLDCRTAVGGVPLSRQLPRPMNGTASSRVSESPIVRDIGTLVDTVVQAVAQDAVSSHLAHASRTNGPRGVYYVAKVLAKAPVSPVWRHNYPGTVVTWQAGRRVDCSRADLLAMDELDVAMWEVPTNYYRNSATPARRLPRDVTSPVPIVSLGDIPIFGDGVVTDRLRSMNLVGVQRHDDLYLLRFSASRSNERVRRAHPDFHSWFAPISRTMASCLMLTALDESSKYFQVFDESHPLAQWLLKLRAASASGQCAVDPKLAEGMYLTMIKNSFEGRRLSERWVQESALPEAIKPPRDAKGQLVSWSTLVLSKRRTVTADAQ